MLSWIKTRRGLVHCATLHQIYLLIKRQWGFNAAFPVHLLRGHAFTCFFRLHSKSIIMCPNLETCRCHVRSWQLQCNKMCTACVKPKRTWRMTRTAPRVAWQGQALLDGLYSQTGWSSKPELLINFEDWIAFNQLSICIYCNNWVRMLWAVLQPRSAVRLATN